MIGPRWTFCGMVVDGKIAWSWMITLKSADAKGIPLKLKFPLTYAYAEIAGLIHEGRSKVSVRAA